MIPPNGMVQLAGGVGTKLAMVCSSSLSQDRAGAGGDEAKRHGHEQYKPLSFHAIWNVRFGSGSAGRLRARAGLRHNASQIRASHPAGAARQSLYEREALAFRAYRHRFAFA